MDPNRLTQKNQEALHDAQTKALRYGHPEVGVEHLLLALLEQPDGLVGRLLDRVGADTGGLAAELERQLQSRPRVSGPGASGQIAISRPLSEVLERAQKEAARLQDEYVSVEHIVLAILPSGSNVAASRLLRQHGVTPERFLEALTQVRR